MRMVLTERIGGIRRWGLPAAAAGIALVLIRGPGNVLDIGSIGLLFLSVLMMARLANIEKAPLSLSLPGFRESLRRGYLGAAAVMGLSGALLALHLWHHPHGTADGGDTTRVCLRVACGFLVGMAGALLLGTSHLVLPRLIWGILRSFWLPLIAFGVVVSFVLLVDSPAIVIPAGTAICVFVWLRLGDPACLKRGHRMIIADATEPEHETATERPAELWSHGRDTVTVPPWAESLFRRWMQSRPYLSAGRYVRGALYQVFGVWFSYWESILFGLAAAALVLGLLGNKMTPAIALIYFVFADRLIRLPVTSTLLLPGGRREKCRATFAAALITSLLLLGATGVAVALARLGVFLLSGSFSGGAGGLADRTTPLTALFLPAVLVPTTLGIRLTREGRAITWIAWSLSFASVMLFLFWRTTWPDWLGLVLLATMFVFGWVFFLLVLRTARRRWDLG